MGRWTGMDNNVPATLKVCTVHRQSIRISGERVIEAVRGRAPAGGRQARQRGRKEGEG